MVVNGEIIVDENYTSNFVSSCFEVYNKYSNLIEEVVSGIVDHKKLAKCGLTLEDILFFRYVYKREIFYERYRKKYRSDLPSRYHSMWLCEKEQLFH